MHCPSCKTTVLAMTERQGIEIDYCPDCRGVWLDRGELDRLLAVVEPPVPPASRHPSQAPASHPPSSHGHGYDPRRRKPKSLLGELFDF